MNGNIPTFSREFFDSSDEFMTIGNGEIGGKAQGLAFIKKMIDVELGKEPVPGITLNIPRLAVVTTEVYDLFIKRNDLADLRTAGMKDHQIAHAFLGGDFPTEYVGDLMSLISEVTQPLAVRSSSLLEDALQHPFAGVYATKMIPNNQHDATTRFHKLIDAIKLIWASAYFAEAQSYIKTTQADPSQEKMAVIIQEVVGQRFGDRFYPQISGVARSYNFYRFGNNKPEEGVVDLALGLGKTIVDGGVCWSYCPASPRSGTPYGSVRDMLQNTQLKFWSVNMGKPPAFDPVKEMEYMRQDDLETSEKDGTLALAASTYDGASDRVIPGIRSKGPRLINFASVLTYESIPLNDLIKNLLIKSREYVGADVELEFAVTVDPKSGQARFGLLQIRPMLMSREDVTIADEFLTGDAVIVRSNNVLGNGKNEDIRYILYVKPETFDKSKTREISEEIAQQNEQLLSQGHQYILIGFGRWGSSDPWLGIPVVWANISAARAIVECTTPEMNVDLSQGSHFFHNLTSMQVPYLSVRHSISNDRVNWEFLNNCDAEYESQNIRLIQVPGTITVQVDGNRGIGVINDK